MRRCNRCHINAIGNIETFKENKAYNIKITNHGIIKNDYRASCYLCSYGGFNNLEYIHKRKRKYSFHE